MMMRKAVLILALAMSALTLSCTPENTGSAVNGWENIGKDDPDKPGSENPEKPEIPDNPEKPEHFFKMRGLVLGWSEVSNARVIDYISISKKNGINTFSVYNAPRGTQVWTNFEKNCKDAKIDIEFEEHMMSFLLPRERFDNYPEWFRMDKNGNRTKDANGCPSSDGALNEVYRNAIDIGRRYASTNHRYYFWLDDGGDICHCPKCKDLNASDQALIFENKAIEALKTIDPEAKLAHLCYSNTLEPPRTVKPHEDIFLEFAPFFRTWDQPLANTWAKGRSGITHAEYLKQLKANLKVFPAATAQVLEYWMDDSLFSEWDENNLVEVPWSKEIFLKDLETYASHGITNITCYAAYVGPKYVQKFGYPKFLDEYGQGLMNYGAEKQGR